MDTLIEFASQSIAEKSGIAEVIMATLPAALFLKGGRNLQLCALAVLAGAIALILFGIDGPAGALVVVVANILVLSAAMLTMRKRLIQVEANLDAAKSSIRDLEISEGRRQVFSAKTSSEPTSSSASF